MASIASPAPTLPQNVSRPIESQSDPHTSSTPLEMSSLPSTNNMQVAQPASERQLPDSMEAGIAQLRADEASRTDPNTQSSNADLQSSPTTLAAPAQLTRLQSTAIGPSSDEPIPVPKEVEETGPILMITLLLINGARHPFKLDAKYLSKRNVEVPGNDPFNLSVYKLKELILREWREGPSTSLVHAARRKLTTMYRMGSQTIEPKLNKTDLVWQAPRRQSPIER
jgi:hypothetical protein